MSDVSHTVCFKNLMSCLMNNLPFITVTTIVSVSAAAGWVVVMITFGAFLPPDDSAPWLIHQVVYAIAGAAGLWVAWILLFLFVPYLWSEVMAIVPAIKNCVKCRGERSRY